MAFSSYFVAAAVVLCCHLSFAACYSWSGNFINGQSPSFAVCSSWATFAAGLSATPGAYESITISSTLGTPTTCANQNSVNILAAAMRNRQQVSLSCNGITWGVGIGCGSGCGNGAMELYAGPGAGPCCCCVGWSVRPEIVNYNWGHGGNAQTCFAPSQTITVDIVDACKPTLTGTISTTPANGIITVGHAFHISFGITDSCKPLVDVYINWGDGSNMVRGDIPSGSTVDYWHIYETDGDFCIAVCLDNQADSSTCATYFNGGCSKRGISFNSATVSVQVAVAGDPYFYGFDGKIFKFVGETGHAYNLISAPTLQVNCLIDRARSSDGVYTMPSIIRQVGLLWGGKSLANSASFFIDTHGNLQVEVMSEGRSVLLSQNEEQSLILGGNDQPSSVSLQWKPNCNYTRDNSELHLNPHLVLHQLTLHHFQFHVDLFAVSMKQSIGSGAEFFFVDMQASLRDRASCFEGVWGRTSCHSSQEEFDRTLYDLRGNIFGIDFPLNLYGSGGL